MFEKINSIKRNILADCVMGVLLLGAGVYAFASRFGSDHQDPSPSAIIVMVLIGLFCMHALVLLWLAYKNYKMNDKDKAIKFLGLAILLLVLFSRIAFNLGYVFLSDYPNL